MASIADLSVDEKSKIKNFSYISILAGFAFIIGPYIGGKFSDRTIYSWFSAAVPLQMAAVLSLINFFFLLFFFHETTSHHKNVKFDVLESIRNISQALHIKKLKTIYVIYFLYLFAWVILMQFTPVLVIEKFQFTNSEIGNMAAFMGICWVAGSFLVQKEIFKSYSFRVLEIVLLIFTACCFFVIFPRSMWATIFMVSLAMFICGIAWPICTGIISNMATQKMQGKIMGISQSMQSLAMTIGPIIGGFVVHFSKELTFVSAGIASLIASIIYFRVKL
jgi:predicted MFS family arabinose efflux permease